MTKIVYEGYLKKIGSINSDLYIDNYDLSLKDIIQQDSVKYGYYLVVKYWISEMNVSDSKLDEKLMNTYFETEKENNVFYFEISEYLWKDEGRGCSHDLVGELAAYIGKYCKLEVEYSKEPQTHDKFFVFK
jgi:hypothetical protein